MGGPVSSGGRVKYGSDVFGFGRILGSGKVHACVFRFYGLWVDPTVLERLFCELFFFC